MAFKEENFNIMEKIPDSAKILGIFSVGEIEYTAYEEDGIRKLFINEVKNV